MGEDVFGLLYFIQKLYHHPNFLWEFEAECTLSIDTSAESERPSPDGGKIDLPIARDEKLLNSSIINKADFERPSGWLSSVAIVGDAVDVK